MEEWPSNMLQCEHITASKSQRAPERLRMGMDFMKDHFIWIGTHRRNLTGNAPRSVSWRPLPCYIKKLSTVADHTHDGGRWRKRMISESEVLQALQLACSQDPKVMTVGDKQLESWKAEKNFYATLAVREMHDTHAIKVTIQLDSGCRGQSVVGASREVDGHY